MAEAECTAKKWGNSLGIIIPKHIVEKEHLKENEKVFVTIKKKHRAGEFFGLFPDWKAPTETIKNQMKKGWK